MRTNISRILSLVVALSVTMTVFSHSAGAQYRNRNNSYAALYDSEVAQALRDHIGYISSSMMEGRLAGSEGELETAKYVTEVLESYGAEILSGKEGDLFGLKGETDTITSRNVVAVVAGSDKKLRERYIVIGARLDNLGTMTVNVDGEKQNRIFYGANSNASGLAMMMELAKMLKTNAILLKRSVIFVGFGASSVMNSGSWYFLNRSFKDVAIGAMINLDMVGTGNYGFYAYTSSNADMNAIVTQLRGELQPIHPTLTSKEPFPSDHRSFYEKEIPSILFTTGDYPERNSDRDTEDIIDFQMMERELEYVYSYSVALSNASAPVFNPSAELRKKNSTDASVVPYYDCDYKPTFLGSSDPNVFLQKWVYQYLKYPETAIKNGLQGRVLVDFIISETGKVTDVKVLKGVAPSIDEEAIRVISASPDWKPGRVKGEKVKTEISMYVEFRLEKKGSKRSRK